MNPLRALERALTRLRIRNAAGDPHAKATAYAFVQEIWNEVEPALSQYVSKADVRAKRREA
jgi:hypothetical protein